MADVSISVSTETSGMPTVRIEDAVITAWIEERLNDARNTFIQHMSGGGGGNVNRRTGHVYSAPGDYPATDTGRLANSVDFQMNDPRSGTLFSDVEYAAYLTEGTSRMASRRMLPDALQEVLDARPQEDELVRAVVIESSTR